MKSSKRHITSLLSLIPYWNVYQNELSDRRDTKKREMLGTCDNQVAYSFRTWQTQGDVYNHLPTPSFTDDVLATVLALYMHEKKQPLPSHEEVLICTSETTTEEVIDYLGTVLLSYN